LGCASPLNETLIRRKKEEGRRKKEEGRRKKEEGRRKKEEVIFPITYHLLPTRNT
jgi:tRNA nucleotidyltransferase (CCA-adding enzyme)